MKLKDWCVAYGTVAVVCGGGLAAHWAYGDQLGAATMLLGMLATVGALVVLAVLIVMAAGIRLDARDSTLTDTQP